MEEALLSTIKFCRVHGIMIDLREYIEEDLFLAIEIIWVEHQTNFTNEPALILHLPGMEQPVTILECYINRIKKEH